MNRDRKLLVALIGSALVGALSVGTSACSGGNPGGWGGGAGGASGGAAGGTGGSAGGTGDAGPGSLSGALAFPVGAALMVGYTFVDGGFQDLVVGLFEGPATCTSWADAGRAMEVDFACTPGPLAPGVHPVAAVSPPCIIGFKATTADGGFREARSGTMNVTTSTASRITASFDVTMTEVDGGDPTSLTGTFDAPGCP